VKLAVVVQRYGAGINGGAELHARYIAEHLARHAEVEVLTTCATDYLTWRNELPPGRDRVNGIAVHRFPVTHPRDVKAFARHSERVFDAEHSVGDEIAWLDSEGPTSPELVRRLKASRHAYDYFIFFSYRYYHSYYGPQAVAPRAVLVPTAERDPAIGVSIFQPVLRGVRALMYNSFEERAMIQAVSGNADVPGVVVGVGSEVLETPRPERFRQKLGVEGRFAIYVGRIDENKGCKELFEYFQRYVASRATDLSLVLAGNPVLSIPAHPRIRHLGFLDDHDKSDAIAAAELLVMPSIFESLSMVALEAWALGRPVLANGRCDVLKGQCIRSNAGLYYDNYEEFAATLHCLETDRWLNAALGRNGREFFRRHYSWPVIERKYMDMFERLTRDEAAGPIRPMEPVPGWLARRRRVPPAREVVDRLPVGPSLKPGRSAPGAQGLSPARQRS
jgi:glycosyltransferase involved in cell wall biosynthesis